MVNRSSLIIEPTGRNHGRVPARRGSPRSKIFNSSDASVALSMHTATPPDQTEHLINFVSVSTVEDMCACARVYVCTRTNAYIQGI